MVRAQRSRRIGDAIGAMGLVAARPRTPGRSEIRGPGAAYSLHRSQGRAGAMGSIVTMKRSIAATPLLPPLGRGARVLVGRRRMGVPAGRVPPLGGGRLSERARRPGARRDARHRDGAAGSQLMRTHNTHTHTHTGSVLRSHAAPRNEADDDNGPLGTAPRGSSSSVCAERGA